MSLRNAILGVLTADEVTGYEFAKQFQDSTGYLWAAPHSQIYRELRQMESEQLVEGQDEARGTARKRRYHITDFGREQFQSWLDEEHPYPPERDAHRLQALYCDMMDPATAHAHFEAHIRHWEGRLSQWEERRDAIEARRVPLLRRRLALRPVEEHEAIIAYKVHVFEGQIARAKVEITWARRGLALIERLSAGEPRQVA